MRRVAGLYTVLALIGAARGLPSHDPSAQRDLSMPHVHDAINLHDATEEPTVPATVTIANGFSGADASIYCSVGSQTCLVQVHAVWFITPSDITVPIAGAANYTLDGGESIEGGLMVPERKILTGWCPPNVSSCVNTGLSEEWCWEYLAVVSIPGVKTLDELDPSLFPKEICINAWVHDAAAGGEVTVADPVCATFTAPYLITAPQKVPHGMKVLISQGLGFAHAPTSVCVGDTCRSSAHIVVIAQSDDPTVDMILDGAYSLDEGKTWRTDSAINLYESWFASNASGTAPGEAFGYFTTGLWRVYQYDVDLYGPEALYGSICVRVQVEDSASHAIGTDTKCIPWCRTPGYIPPAYIPTDETAWQPDACPCEQHFYALPDTATS